MTIFQAPSARPNQAQVQTLGKTGALFTQPLWKPDPVFLLNEKVP